MARKSRDEYVEQLEKQIRELKSVNRQLTKRLRKLDKHFRETLELEEEVLKVRKPKNEDKFDCPQCKKGILLNTPMGPKVFTKCDNCAYKKTTNV